MFQLLQRLFSSTNISVTEEARTLLEELAEPLQSDGTISDTVRMACLLVFWFVRFFANGGTLTLTMSDRGSIQVASFSELIGAGGSFLTMSEDGDLVVTPLEDLDQSEDPS